jgi:acetyl esterase/lipase
MRLAAIIGALMVLGGVLDVAHAQMDGAIRHPRAMETVARETIEAGKRADGSPIEVTLSARTDGAAAKMPVVLLLHGGVPAGVPRPSTWQAYASWGSVLASSGVAAVMFDHSLGFPKRELDRALAELDQVLAWLAREGEARGLDTGNVTVMTFSAGGLFVPSLVDAARPLKPARIVMFYPLTGVVPGSPTAAVTEADLAERMSLKSAAPMLARCKARLVVLRAGADEVRGLSALLDESVAALLAADARVEMINLPGAPHSFDFKLERDDVRLAIDRAIELARSAAP